jgi:hypothetical protein
LLLALFSLTQHTRIIYAHTQEDKPVFLFNRKHLTPGAPPPKETGAAAHLPPA